MLYRILFLFFLVTACQKTIPDPVSERDCWDCMPMIRLEGPAPSLRYVGDFRIDALTGYLAAQEQVESEQLGFSGIYSEVYQVYLQLREQASMEQLRLLLQHESPNVRYYALLGLASRDPEHMDFYYQQLGGKKDTIRYLRGCVGGSGELGDYVKIVIENNIKYELPSTHRDGQAK